MLSKLLRPRRPDRPVAAREAALKVIRRSEVEAKANRAKCIEAEHILLALAAHPDSDMGKLLSAHGLDHERLASALRDERRRSLAFAGVQALVAEQTEPTELDGSLSLGTSAKVAIKRAMIASRTSRPRRVSLESTDLLIGILQAELGTVPRALAIVGVDRAGLISGTRKPAQNRDQTC